jgi:hypothetical protein
MRIYVVIPSEKYINYIKIEEMKSVAQKFKYDYNLGKIKTE